MNTIREVAKMMCSVIHSKCPVCGGKLYFVSTTIEEMNPNILKCEKCKREWVNEYYEEKERTSKESGSALATIEYLESLRCGK